MPETCVYSITNSSQAIPVCMDLAFNSLQIFSSSPWRVTFTGLEDVTHERANYRLHCSCQNDFACNWGVHDCFWCKWRNQYNL